MELNKIYNESNLATMSRMPDLFVDFVITSPPYDDMRDYNGYSFPFEEIAKELYRVMKDGGVMIWVVNDATKDGTESLTSCKQKIYFREQCGFNIHDTMIYEKKNYVPLTHNRYEQVWEYMFVLSKGKPKTFNPLMKDNVVNGKTSGKRRERDGSMNGFKFDRNDKSIRENIWNYSVGFGNSSSDKIAFNHPAIAPEQMIADHIYSWTNEGDIIYDCFGGSGTAAKMAHLQKRNWILSEISEEYCKLAEKRIEPYLMQQSLF